MENFSNNKNNKNNKNMHSSQFLQAISFESLFKAHMRARKCKRFKKEVIEFELNLSKNLWELHFDLLYGKYKIGGYHKFMIYDPKEREIQAITYRDRVVQHSVCDNFLTPLLDRRLFFYNVACRKKKGTSCAVEALKSFMLKHYKTYGNSGYFVKADIKKYFNSVDHSVLKKLLADLHIPFDLLALLYLIIDSYCFSPDKGLPMGNQTSQCFALLYLDEVDRTIKEELRVKFYVRYMDDLIAVIPQKNSAANALASIANGAASRLLFLNKKSQIISFCNGVEFLGRRFFIGKNGKVVQKLTHATKKRVRKRVLKNLFLVKSGKKPIDFLLMSAQSYAGFFCRINSHSYFNNSLSRLARANY